MVATVKTELVENNAIAITWEELGGAETGPQASVARWVNRSVQVKGTFGGATVVLHGSNDGVTFAALNDLEGNPISLTAAGILSIMENTRFVRPVSSGGTGSDIDVILYGV